MAVIIIATEFMSAILLHAWSNLVFTSLLFLFDPCLLNAFFYPIMYLVILSDE